MTSSDAPSCETSIPKKRGRPKDLHKHEAIISAARTLFFRHGIEAVSIENIALDAGVSKVTVYGHFGDKEMIFESMVRLEATTISRSLLDLSARKKSARETLVAFGLTFLGFFLNPEQQAFTALVAQEAQRHPELARRFFDAGPSFIRGEIARVIRTAHDAGLIRVEDVQGAAEDLLALWQGPMALEIRLGIRPKPTRAELLARAKRGVDLLFRAYANAHD